MQFGPALKANLTIEVVARTWARETHNLFDFEAKESTITSQTFTIRDSVTCERVDNEVSAVSNSTPSECSRSEGEKLIQVEWRHGKAWLNRPRWGSVDDRRIQRCWQLIRNGDATGNAGHRLAENDIIKFGRSQFRVRQLCVKAEAATQPAIQFDGACGVCKVDPTEFDELADERCRICLTEGSSAEDPLLAPCQCKGSIQYVHLGCLKHWVRDRLGLSNGDAAFVVGGNSNSMTCELCKTTYQSSVQMGKTILPLVEINSPFAVLESCSDHRLHVLPIVDGKSVRIGRGHECNMNIHDTSISRVQATIEFVDGVFVLKDQGSRFGTYAKITKSLMLEVGQQFSVQVGRTVFQLSAKKATRTAELESLQQPVSPEASLQGDEALDTDITESPRGSGRSVNGKEQSSTSQDEFVSCEGGAA